jgi:uncharacterized protein YbjQ (UPF0145 family)
MLVATLSAIEGRPVQWYLGIVSGETVLDARGVGCRTGTYEKELREAREAAVVAMLNEAAERGANAVVGVHFAYEAMEMPEKGPVLMVTTSGTAVRI